MAEIVRLKLSSSILNMGSNKESNDLKTLSRNSEFNWFGDFCFGAVFDRFKQYALS